MMFVCGCVHGFVHTADKAVHQSVRFYYELSSMGPHNARSVSRGSLSSSTGETK